MPTLLEISDAMLELDAKLAAAADEGGNIEAVQTELENLFNSLAIDRDKKIDAYCGLIREKELRSAARKEESERLLKRVKIDTDQVAFLKARLKQFLEEHSLKKLETDRFAVSVANNGGRLPISIDVEPEQLPDEFKRVTIEPDMQAINAALDAGQDLLFVTKGVRGTHLRIR